jgi:UDP-GlcNAc:undecaprenyl-phosphate GlcNAc-1-phosphate transferase
MGDTGALFLGYTLAVLSIQGCFKLNGIISFWVPMLVFALPLADTTFAFARRILTGKTPNHSINSVEMMKTNRFRQLSMKAL